MLDWIDAQHEREIDDHGSAVIAAGVLLRFTLASPHWTFVELRHEKRAHALEVKAHVDRCVMLTAEEEAAWKAEIDPASETEEEEE